MSLSPSARHNALCAAFLALSSLACNPTDSGGGSSHGPAGGILDFDAAAIPTTGGTSTTPPPVTDASIGLPDVAPGIMVCAGVATSCSSLLDVQCSSVMGCTSGGTCGGSATICGFIFSDFSCVSQQGCVWSSSSNTCEGFAWTCDTFNGVGSCDNQQGCSWTPGCAGNALACALIPTTECTKQPGCHVETH
jgi:hypothetical protein